MDRRSTGDGALDGEHALIRVHPRSKAVLLEAREERTLPAATGLRHHLDWLEDAADLFLAVATLGSIRSQGYAGLLRSDLLKMNRFGPRSGRKNEISIVLSHFL